MSAGALKKQRQGFNFTDQIRIICEDMVSRLPELSHIDLTRVAMAYSQVRRGTVYGVLATMTPLRFEAGATTVVRHGQTYTSQRLYDERGTEMLYILTCYLPRFMNHTLEEKILTILHELWHISPMFNGDLRRFAGRCYAHGNSQVDYDRQVEDLAHKWWSMNPPTGSYDFLRHRFTTLQSKFGQVIGVKIPRPKLIPVAEVADAKRA